MKNKLQDGLTWTGAAPYALVAGAGALVGAMFGVAVNDAANGATVVLERVGVFTLVKATGSAWTAGELLYWDDTAKAVTDVSTSNTRIGYAVGAAASGDTTGDVQLTGL